MTDKFTSKFIVLDGPDGCGKSTQAQLLAQWVNQHNVVSATFRDPGTTAIGEKIRRILLNPENKKMSTRTELLLYMAARAQLWQEEIKPALHQGKCVIMDRWLSSTCAYQGYAGRFGIENIIEIARVSLERSWPNITVILDIDIETAWQRLDKQLDRMEQKGRQYHQKVREGFLKLAADREDFIIIDALGSVNEVHQKIIDKL